MLLAQQRQVDIAAMVEEAMIQLTVEKEMERKKEMLENIVQKCIQYDKEIRSAKEKFEKIMKLWRNKMIYL